MDDYTARLHRRYRQQAAWTRSVRDWFWQSSGLSPTARVLEVGCGTGALLEDLRQEQRVNAFGLDKDLEVLTFARNMSPANPMVCGDGHTLPLRTASCDAVICHFLLLWVADPAAILREMRRVTRPSGWVAAFGEPDYSARIEYPPPFERLGKLQASALTQRCARVDIGRQLPGLFASAGLTEVQSGVLGGAWKAGDQLEESELEWETLAHDLRGEIPEADLRLLKELDIHARAEGSRVQFVPTFYAFGRVPPA